MIDSGARGAIVSVASEAGKKGHIEFLAYSASKAALINMTRVLSVTLAPHDINVNCVCPGGVATDMLREVAVAYGKLAGQAAEDVFPQLVSSQLVRHIEPVEVARTISFLLSDDAIIIRGKPSARTAATRRIDGDFANGLRSKTRPETCAALGSFWPHRTCLALPAFSASASRTKAMKRIVALALSFAALFASASLADEKPLFVYVSPNPIGVNDFLKLGKIGTERVAQALGGVAKTYESSDPTTQRQNLEAAAKAGAKVVVVDRLRVQRHAARGGDRLSERAIPAGRQLSLRQTEAEHPLLGVSRI